MAPRNSSPGRGHGPAVAASSNARLHTRLRFPEPRAVLRVQATSPGGCGQVGRALCWTSWRVLSARGRGCRVLVAGAGAPQTRTGCHSHGPRRSAAPPRMGGHGHRGAKRLCPLPGPLGGRRFLEERHWGQHFGARRKQSRAQGRAGLRCSQHRGLGLPRGNRGSRRQGRGGGPRPVAPFRTVCSVGRARWGWGRC